MLSWPWLRAKASSEVAEMLALGEQTVRDYRNQYLFKGMASLVYKAPPGRPSKLTKTQRQQLAEWIKASPQDCWLYLGMLEYADDSGPHLASLSAWSTIPTISRPYSRIWAFLIRKPGLSQIISMRPNASNGATLGGPRFCGKPGSTRPCCSLAMRPVLPSGAR